MLDELPGDEAAESFREGLAPILSSLNKPRAAMRMGKDIVGTAIGFSNALVQQRFAGA